MYLNGDVFEEDLSKAREYLEIAANRGNGRAFSALGYIYSTGKGVEISKKVQRKRIQNVTII